MGLFQRHKGKKPHRRKFTKAELASLRKLEYAEDFNLPEEAETLYRISQYADTGGRFIVKKRFETGGYRSVFVAAFDHYPSLNQIGQEVYPKYGGGTYTVHPEGRAGQFASHTFGGTSRYEPLGPKPKSRRGELDDETRRRLEDFLRDLEWKDPELWQQVNLARLEKEWDIEIPREDEHEPDWQDRMLQEYLERHPEVKDEVYKARLRGMGVEIPEEPDELGQSEKWMEVLIRLENSIERGARARDTANVLVEGVGLVQDFLRMRSGDNSTGGTPAPVPPQLTPPTSHQSDQQPQSQSIPREPQQISHGNTPVPPLEEWEPVIRGQSGVTSPNPRTVDANPRLPWYSLLTGDDWNELEEGIHGDSGEFVDRLQDKGRGGSFHHSLVLYALTEPSGLVEAVSEAVKSLRVTLGRGEEYEVAVLVFMHLTETAEGKRWMEDAHGAARALRDDADDGSGVEVVDGGQQAGTSEDDEVWDSPELL